MRRKPLTNPLARRRHTTAAEDMEFLRSRYAEMNTPREVGDEVASWDMRSTSRIARIEGDIVHLENGDHMHVTKVRNASAVKR